VSPMSKWLGPYATWLAHLADWPRPTISLPPKKAPCALPRPSPRRARRHRAQSPNCALLLLKVKSSSSLRTASSTTSTASTTPSTCSHQPGEGGCAVPATELQPLLMSESEAGIQNEVSSERSESKAGPERIEGTCGCTAELHDALSCFALSLAAITPPSSALNSGEDRSMQWPLPPAPFRPTYSTRRHRRRFHALHYRAWKAALAEWNCDFPEDLFYSGAASRYANIIAA